MNDPLIDEVRRIRESYSSKFYYDLEAIFEELKCREQNCGLKFIDGVAHLPPLDQSGSCEMTQATCAEDV